MAFSTSGVVGSESQPHVARFGILASADGDLEFDMGNHSTVKSDLRFGPLMAATLLLTVAGCNEKRADGPPVDPFAPSAQDQAPDPLKEAHQRGWLWAQRADAKLITDCGAITDADERFGCATYVNNRSD